MRHINWQQLVLCFGELGGFVIQDAQEPTLGLKDGIGIARQHDVGLGLDEIEGVVGWGFNWFADVATFKEPGWDAFVFLEVGENEFFGIGVDAAKNAGEFLIGKFVLAVEREPEATWAGIG